MVDGDELYIRIIKTERLAKTTVAQQLAEQAADKTVRTWDQIVPSQYHQHAKVFSETAAHRFPESWEWDHAIDLKADALSTLDCKVYPLSPGEDVALQTFLSQNLAKGYIHPSKSPYAFPFFFIKKKNGDVTDDRNRACTHGAKAKPEGSDEVRNCRCRSREHDAETSHT